MITKIFNVELGLVKPTLHCYTIPELANIINKYPTDHINMLAYAFYISCPYKSENPYADYSEEDKEEILLKDYDIDPDNPDIIKAIEKLKSMYETVNSKHLIRNKKNLEAIMDFIEESSVSEENIRYRLAVAEKCGKVMMEYTSLEKQAEEEKNRMKTKADRKIGKGEL